MAGQIIRHLILCLGLTGSLLSASAQEKYRNIQLMRASQEPDGGSSSRTYQFYKHQRAHNAGTRLYEDDLLSIHLTANLMPQKKRGKQLSGNERLFFESEICSEIQAPFLKDSRENIQHASLAVVLKKDPGFELTRRWLWDTLRPIIRLEIVDQYCGGKIQFVFANLYIYGYEIGNSGSVELVVDRRYPEFDLGNEQDRRRLGQFRILALAQANFYFWDKFSPSLQAKYIAANLANGKGLHLSEWGVNAAQGSYYEVFNPWMPLGGAGSFYRESTSLVFYAQSSGKSVPNPPAGYVESFTGLFKEYNEHLKNVPLPPSGSNEAMNWYKKHGEHVVLTQDHRDMIQALMSDEILLEGIGRAYEKHLKDNSRFSKSQVQAELLMALAVNIVQLKAGLHNDMEVVDAINASRRWIDSIAGQPKGTSWIPQLMKYETDMNYALCKRVEMSATSGFDMSMAVVMLESMSERIEKRVDSIFEAADAALKRGQEKK